MSLTLGYNDVLAGVTIDLSNTSSKRLHVERSINEMLWETVRGGADVAVESGVTTIHDYEFASDTENFYRASPIFGPGLVLIGEPSGRATTPSTSQLNYAFGANLDLRADITPERWKGEIQYIISKYVVTGNQRSYALFLTAEGRLRFSYSDDGSTDTLQSLSSTIPVPGIDGRRKAVRVTVSQTTGQVRFYTATSVDGPWQQLGSTVSWIAFTGVFPSTVPLEIGSHTNGTQRNFSGVIHRVQLRSGIGGTIIANPRFEDQADGATSFADSTGKTWTIQNNAAIGNVISDSITPSLDGEVWLKSIRYPGLNQIIEFQDYSDIEMAGNAHSSQPSGRSLPIGTTDVQNGMAMGIILNTEDEEDVRKLMVTLAVGDIFFLHVPPNGHPALPPKSFYFMRMDTTIERWVDHLERRLQHFRAVECLPPAPQFVGINLTWGTIFRLYGSSAQLINANPSWKPLLETVGGPDDLVVM